MPTTIMPTTIINERSELCLLACCMHVPSVPRLFLMWNHSAEPCHRQCQQGSGTGDHATGSSVPLETARALVQSTGNLYSLLLELILNKPGTMEPAPKTRVSTAFSAFHYYWNQAEPLEPTDSLCRSRISARRQAALPYRFVLGKYTYLIECVYRLLRKAHIEMKSSVLLLTTNYPMEVYMYKRNKTYDGTILQGLVPEIPSKSSVKITQGSAKRTHDADAEGSATVRHRVDATILAMAFQGGY